MVVSSSGVRRETRNGLYKMVTLLIVGNNGREKKNIWFEEVGLRRNKNVFVVSTLNIYIYIYIYIYKSV